MLPDGGATHVTWTWWRTSEQGFKGALDRYLSGVESRSKVDPLLAREAVQMQWSQVREPWVPFDREARLVYESTEHREQAKTFPEVEAALAKLVDMYQASLNRAWHDQWKEPEQPKGRHEGRSTRS